MNLTTVGEVYHMLGEGVKGAHRRRRLRFTQCDGKPGRWQLSGRHFETGHVTLVRATFGCRGGDAVGDRDVEVRQVMGRVHVEPGERTVRVDDACDGQARVETGDEEAGSVLEGVGRGDVAEATLIDQELVTDADGDGVLQRRLDDDVGRSRAPACDDERF